jgi:HD-GYP domain-containing protein (c-di-GMP phosphodiesterase class II)
MISKTSIGIETKNSFAQTAKNRQLRVPVSSLELGLFVSELDRPWIETRFLLQGFLLENEADLESLRIYCNHVYIDLRLSDEKVAVQWQATVAPSLEQVDSAQDASDKERVLTDEPELPTDSDPTPVRSDLARESGDEQLETNARTLVDPTTIENLRTRRTRSDQARNDPAVSDGTRLRFVELVRAIAIDEQQNARAFLDRMSDWFNSQLIRNKASPESRTSERESGEEQVETNARTLVGPTPIENLRTGRTRSAQARNYPPVSDGTRLRFLELVRAIAIDEQQNGRAFLDRMSDWFNSWLDRNKASPESRTSEQVSSELGMASILPQGVSLTVYENTTPVEAELPRARQAFIQGENVARDIANQIQTDQLPDIPAVKACVDNIVDSMISNPDAVMIIARLRDEDINTYHHGVKVSLYLIALGRHLGIPRTQLAELGLIGMLADVGKIKLPRAILAKPGELSPAEFEIVKEHVDLSLASLDGAAGLTPAVLQGIAQHHERLDGSGYPKGLTGNQLGVYGRMTAIADSFSSMTTPRPYANASLPQEALLNLYECRGTLLSAPLVEQFVQAIGVFPVGSLVELSSGEVAVVIAHNRIRRLEPKVLVLTSPDKSPLATPVERDLFELGKSSRERLRITKGVRMNSFNLSIRDYYLLNDTVIDESGDGPDRQDASSQAGISQAG